MPSVVTHTELFGLWKQASRSVVNGKHPDDALRDVMVDVAKMCHAIANEKLWPGSGKRIYFLFIDKEHGLAGWAKEAL